MDKYEALRNLNPLTVLNALGVDILTFKKRSNKPEWYGACPICKPKHNKTAFSVHQDGRWNCFSCNTKGKGMLDLVKAIRKCNFTDAVAFLEPLASQAPSDTKKEPVEAPSASGGILQPLSKDTWKQFAVPCPWLEQRVPEKWVRELYGVYMYLNPARKSAYSGRVMLPVRDVEGVLYGYLGRTIENTSPSSVHQTTSNQEVPKYLFPKNLPKSRFLFGSDVLKAGKFGGVPLKRVWLVESPFAVLHFATLNLPAVSCYGWSVSPEQVHLLQSLAKGCIYVPDRNKRQDAQACVAALASILWVRFPPLPDGIEDPEHLDKDAILALTR